MRIVIILVLLAGILAAPFLLRPKGREKTASLRNSERLVIITPHNQSIQAEFGKAFVRYMKQAHGRNIYIDWRTPGGTSEIARFLKSEYATRFETLWKKKTNGLRFTHQIREAFTNRNIKIPETSQGMVPALTLLSRSDSDEERAIFARRLFLESDIGVGIDLFFGGGAYDFTKQAQAGNLVSRDASGKYGPSALAEQHPDWFSDAIMPAKVSGEPFRDPEFRWVGTVLSSFGICYNDDVFKRLGIQNPPAQWTDLTDVRLLGQLALADPTKSGSTTKAFEMLIQQQMRIVLDAGSSEHDAIREGWNNAMRMIFKISANGRYFTDAATKVPFDVASGDAAAGMCIDFYGRTYNELHQKKDGTSRVHFVMPEGGTSIGADPIGMLRGAANPELAHRFIEFILSTEGQKLWNYRPGTKGGPRRAALRRPPIRKDFYTEENRKFMADPAVNPYHIAEGFTYEGNWTGALFNPMRFIIRCACVDTHEEQQSAWRDIIKAGMPEEALREFEDLTIISFDKLQSEIVPVLKSKNKIKEVELARKLSGLFREKYKKCRELCE